MSHIHARVLYIGSSKRLNDYYTPRDYYTENDKRRIVGSDAARRIDPSIFNLPPMQPLLPRAPPVIAPPPVFRLDWKTLVRLAST
jgi:hypothetical protein